MSHSFGLKCGQCKTVLVSDKCAERGCTTPHGHTFMNDPEWIKRTFGHECATNHPRVVWR